MPLTHVGRQINPQDGEKKTESHSQIRALVLYANYASYAKEISYLDDWLEAFAADSEWQCQEVDIAQRSSANLVREEMAKANVIVLLHSTNADSLFHLNKLLPLLRKRTIPIVAFIGNEVNLPSALIGDKRNIMQELEAEVIATQLPIEAGNFLWSDIAKIGVIALPHALNPRIFRFETPHSSRVLDVGIRGIRYGSYLGDNDRNQLMDAVNALPRSSDLRVDVSTSRFNRLGWSGYLNSTRTTFSSEAGSWFLEKDDQTLRLALAKLSSVPGRKRVITPSLRISHLYQNLPGPLRQTTKRIIQSVGLQSSSSGVEDLFLSQELGASPERVKPDVYSKCISSRHFDAIGTGTTQILLEGRYNGILTAGEHYIELKSDYSNWSSTIELLKEHNEVENIAHRALEHVLAQHTYRHRIQELGKFIDDSLI